MKASQILNKVLLNGKQITISFSSPQALTSFRNSLHTYLSRYRQQMEKIGDTSLADYGISVMGTHESATFSLVSKAARKKHNYQILDISEQKQCEDMNQSGSP